MRRGIAAFAAAGLVAAASLTAGGFGCGGSTRAATEEPVEPVELHPGETATVADGELVVTFVSVLEDSRCPKGEQCITAGRARLSFEARPRFGEAVRFDLDTSREAGDDGILGFQVTLLDLQPYPVSGRPTPPQDYLARLSVRRS
ncbi:MAG: hypothetical protein ABW056_09160 [Thermoanaerobaculia bacterium]